MKFSSVIIIPDKLLLPVIFLTAFLPQTTRAQNPAGQTQGSSGLYTYVQNKYGLDHDLVNGIQYYNRYYRVLHHPFYRGEESLPGSVTVAGKHFDNLMINYNIYNQWLTLEYRESSGGINRIILEPEKTDSFQIDGHSFDKLDLDENGPLFYEVIGTKGIKCYIHWKKQLLLTSNNLDYAEYFTIPSRTYFLEYNNTINPFSNRRNFIPLLPASAKHEVRKYLRKNNIRFRKVTVMELDGLLEYISGIHQ